MTEIRGGDGVPNAQQRKGSLWQRLTGPPEGHEGPWPVEVDAVGRWLGFLAAATFFLAAAMAISVMLAEFGAHPVLRFLVTSGLAWLAIFAARAWHGRPSSREVVSGQPSVALHGDSGPLLRPMWPGADPQPSSPRSAHEPPS